MGWLDLFRRACDRIAAVIATQPRSERRRELGRGAGGDATTLVDRLAEDVVIEELEALAATGARFTLVSEESGVRDFGGGVTRVVLDPIDGSLNAKRGIPVFATSIAVADGPRLGDVWLGVVRDHGTGEDLVARRGGGARIGGRPVAVDGLVGMEVVALETAAPERVARAAARLPDVGRVRMLGSLALALCSVGAGRVDGLAGLGRARAVDIAAAQLFCREAGALVGLPREEDLVDAPIDVSTRHAVVAARDEEGLALLRAAIRA
jgi:myo-inositol-1(or 4)-monophosphatase